MTKQFISLENLGHFWDKVKQIIIDNEQTTSAALNDLNVRVDSLEENESLNDHIDNDDIHVTAEDKAKWDAATENNGDGHTHSNKEVLDGITANKVSSWDNKQDTITDLATIRSNAEKGASALQSIPAEYVTETELGTAVNTAITELVGNAPETLNTIEEIADALRDNKDIVSVLETSIATKADKTSIPTKVSDLTNDSKFISSIPAEYVTESELNAKGYLTSHQDISGKANASDLTSHTDNSNIHVTTADKSKWNTAEQNAKSYADGLNTTMSNRIGNLETNVGVNNSGKDLVSRITQLEDGIGVPDARAKVLWLGTSIPAGEPDNNYPDMVGKMLGFQIYNMAQSASCLHWDPTPPTWTTSAEVEANRTAGRCLTATKQEIRDKFYNVLNTIRRNEGLSTTWRDNLIAEFQESSYEARVIPYLDGTIASCDTVVIDHGFNDLMAIYNECVNHANDAKDVTNYWPDDVAASLGLPSGIAYPTPDGVKGWHWLTNLSTGLDYNADTFMSTIYTTALGLQEGYADTTFRYEYFGAFMFLIAKIMKVNPRCRIVIGNYFSQNFGTHIDNRSNWLTKYILEANQQLANWLGYPCVNVYKHTGLRNRLIVNPDGSQVYDMFQFCPADGVHPASDTTGLSNSIIASAYVAQIKGAFFSLV